MKENRSAPCGSPLYLPYEGFREIMARTCPCSPAAAAAGEVIVLARGTACREPAAAFDELLAGRDGFPVHGNYHHSVTGVLLLTCLRNAGYPISEEMLDDVEARGCLSPPGACAFVGTCGAISSVTAALAILLGATPFTSTPRNRLLEAAARLQARLAAAGGSRCCKKSSFIAILAGIEELARLGYSLPAERVEGHCRYFADNRTCDGAACPFFPADG
jgi:hypothetical protein